MCAEFVVILEKSSIYIPCSSKFPMIGQVQTFIAASIHNYYYNSVVFLGIRSHRRQQLAVCVCEMKSQPGEMLPIISWSTYWGERVPL